jgi:hypothetical protein
VDLCNLLRHQQTINPQVVKEVRFQESVEAKNCDGKIIKEALL